MKPGDYLIDWRAGEVTGARYKHQLDAVNVTSLAHMIGLRLIEPFLQGRREGDLSMYSMLGCESTGSSGGVWLRLEPVDS